MKIDEDEVRRIARLAHLALDPAEVERLAGQLDAILAYVDQLDRLDTHGVEPTTHAVPVAQPLRPDEPRPSLTRKQALHNARERDEFTFIVPRVV
ncbi:MAG: glutamyl-tRNA(Gln) amidotransferase subunit C [Myxococcales bacterium]